MKKILQMKYSLFYNHLILSGTKIASQVRKYPSQFYNHLILSGTKISIGSPAYSDMFYNHLILSGTKIYVYYSGTVYGFTIT